MMKKILKRLLLLALFVVMVVALAIPKIVSSDESETSTGGPGRAGTDTLGVDIHVVEPAMLTNRIRTTGTVRADETVDLVSEASGKLTQILFEEGRFVNQGDLLVKINDADLQAQRERALHRLRLAEQREKRQQRILEQGGISQEEYDLALTEVNVLRAEIQLIDAQIAKTEIRAPFSGIVGLRYVSEGSFISPQTRIATLQSLNPIKLDFSVPEKFGGLIEVGDEVLFRVEGRDEQYRGRIYAIEPRISQDTRTLVLRATSPNSNGTLLPGAFADVELILERVDGALSVPSIAVVPELEGKRVYVLSNGVATPRSVETGLRTDTSVQVVHGVAAGDSVITSGLQLIRPGMPVKANVSSMQPAAVDVAVSEQE